MRLAIVRQLSASAVVLLLASCGSNIKKADGDTYLVSVQEDQRGGTAGALKEATEKGTAFCASQNQQFQYVQEQRQGNAGVGFSTIVLTVRFKCK